jgi:hypothetical protein
MQNNPDTTLQIPRDAQMTLTIFRGGIVILLLDVAIQQHDESFFGRLYLPRGSYSNALDGKTNPASACSRNAQSPASK